MYNRDLPIKNIEIPTDAIEVNKEQVDTVETSLDNSKKAGLVPLKAKKFVDLVNSGVKPGEAAAKIGTTLTQINNSDDMRKAVQRLIDVGKLPAQVRKELYRIGLDKMFLESVNSDDIEERKFALSVAKTAGQDPEIATVPAEGQVNVDLREIGGIIKGLEFDGVPKPKE